VYDEHNLGATSPVKGICVKLVIVESPAKAKTIEKFLGKDYKVAASFGHIRDLPSSADEIPEEIRNKPWGRMAVDVENNFQPFYVVQKNSKKHIAELKKLLRNADEIVLATDEDREGESISWHLLEELKPKVPVRRIAFHEITKKAIDEAIRNPREVNYELVRAQESRRILDRLYGYSLSPVLWKKVRTKLSAGRVQSVAVRLVVEREEARRAFHTSEYWDITAKLAAEGIDFEATLSSLHGKRIAAGKDFDADTGELKAKEVTHLQQADAEALAQTLQGATPWKIAAVEQKENRQRPWPPFITSTLQQAASGLLGFSPSRTMQIAQRLYEGVDLGGGEREGLITYMRTDSVTLSEKALADAQYVIKKHYGPEYHTGARRYSTKSKSAQEAHEAIRPTYLDKTPDDLASYLGPEELKLYRLIWRRTIASQMADAELLKTTVDFAASTPSGEAVLRSNGSVVTFPGFLKVADSAQKDTQLPALKQGEEVGPGKRIALEGLEPVKHETKPPARFTEASLVKALEEEGIGRPSTYAPTIHTIQQRGYVTKKGNALVPSFLGIAVTFLLRKHFANYVDFKFTARMEDVLDNIANGKQEWVAFLQGFYQGDGTAEGEFGAGLQPHIEKELERIEFPTIPLGLAADGAPIVVRVGKNSAFVQKGEGGEGNTASVPEDISYEELTVAMAEEFIATKAKGNESLGTDPITQLPVYALIGPYGPYVQLGESDPKNKPKRSSLPKGTDIGAVSLETALEYLRLPREIGPHPEDGAMVKAAIGRFGPYVQWNKEFRSLDTMEQVFTVSLEEALTRLAQPKGRGRAKKLLKELGKHPDTDVAVEIFEGRYGPYVSDGTYNATIPKAKTPEELTMDEAVTLLAEAAERKPKKKKAAAKKKPAAKKKTAAKKKAAAKKKPSP